MRKNNQAIMLTRNELYELVWKKPIIKLAQEWSISDVGLAKACKRHDIPIPPRGYWAKLKYGKPVPERPVLPEDRPEDEQVTISLWYQKFLPSGSIFGNEACIQPQMILSVPPNLKDPHPLVEKAAEILRSTKKADPFLLPRKNSHILSMEVTSTTLERGLRIIDTLVKSLEQLGLSIEIDREHNQTYTMVEGEKIAFTLKETLEKVPHNPTKREENKKKEEWWYRIPKYDYLPSGRLSLGITNIKYLGIRQNWTDGKKQNLEDCLDKFIIGLFRAAEAKRVKREEDEARERAWEEQRRIYEEERKRQLIEQQRIEFIKSDIQQWHAAEEVRAYLEVLKNKSKYLSEADKENLNKWCDWIKSYAESIDPFNKMLPQFSVDNQD